MVVSTYKLASAEAEPVVVKIPEAESVSKSLRPNPPSSPVALVPIQLKSPPVAPKPNRLSSCSARLNPPSPSVAPNPKPKPTSPEDASPASSGGTGGQAQPNHPPVADPMKSR
jgi:hypothetical protein